MFYTAQKTDLPDTWKFSYSAMNTRYDVWLCDADVTYAEQAAFRAFERLVELESQLSRFIPNSEISRINQSAGQEWIRVSPETLECLKIALELYHQTGGRFDPNYKNQNTAFAELTIQSEHMAVKLPPQGLNLDLGGIGKGFAVDLISEELKDWDLERYLISGGRSSVRAGLSPETEEGWTLSISAPETGKQLAAFTAQCFSLGASGLLKGPHIVHPRNDSGPVESRSVWVAAKSAAVADALSTAFMLMPVSEIEAYSRAHNTSVICRDAQSMKSFGPEWIQDF